MNRCYVSFFLFLGQTSCFERGVKHHAEARGNLISTFLKFIRFIAGFSILPILKKLGAIM